MLGVLRDLGGVLSNKIGGKPRGEKPKPFKLDEPIGTAFPCLPDQLRMRLASYVCMRYGMICPKNDRNTSKPTEIEAEMHET